MTNKAVGKGNSYLFSNSKLEINNATYKVVGVYEAKDSYDFVMTDSGYRKAVLTAHNLTNSKSDLDKNTYIYSSNSKNLGDLKSRVESWVEIESIKTYENQQKELIKTTNNVLITTIITTLIFASIPLIGFFFVSRSSVLSQIDEIKIKKTLGISPFTISRQFILEMFFTITFTTIVGLLFMYISLDLILGSFMDILGIEFNTSAGSFFSAALFIYIINIAVGSIPLISILSKTPSTLLSKFDY
jgi:ABC-type antimicrobial peptide transport system permease subunit